MSRIHLGLPNAYKLMSSDRNINGNRDVKFLGFEYLLVQRTDKKQMSGPDLHVFTIKFHSNFS